MNTALIKIEEVAKSQIDNYRARYSDRVIRFNNYTIKKTGLVGSQTLLKIGEYNLGCAPFQLSMERVILLLILSGQEMQFFQQLLQKMCSVSFSFIKPKQPDPINFLSGEP